MFYKFHNNWMKYKKEIQNFLAGFEPDTYDNEHCEPFLWQFPFLVLFHMRNVMLSHAVGFVRRTPCDTPVFCLFSWGSAIEMLTSGKKKVLAIYLL